MKKLRERSLQKTEKAFHGKKFNVLNIFQLYTEIKRIFHFHCLIEQKLLFEQRKMLTKEYLSWVIFTRFFLSSEIVDPELLFSY